MKAFDTDVLTEVLAGNVAFAARVSAIPLEEQIVPVVAVEEILRGRLHAIRQAEASKSRITIDQAYHFFEATLDALREMKLLPYTGKAESVWKDWRTRKIKGSTHDLRIAASCVASSVTLITRNRRDFEHIPGLSVEFWE